MNKHTPIMVMGCSSDAGKSFLCTALCRHFANRGLRVAPFKAQNMSNNAAVTPDGLEIGRAQFVQALAARVSPEARMQPVLLKPQADTMSQAIVLGKLNPEITATPWLRRKALLWETVRGSLRSLMNDFELVVIEGAGSPAEVNLRASDIVNMRVALEANADVYLVADIDRGGAFAHLLGTYQCLTTDEQHMIKGFVLNKFRGDPTLLGDAMDWLRDRTGVPTVAIVPMTTHTLPEEDNIAAMLRHTGNPDDDRQVKIALIAFPYASNFDEFDPLLHEVGVHVTPVRAREPLEAYDAVILPGSKNTAASMKYLLHTGLAAEITAAARRGAMIYGVCGGMQMLGVELKDPHGIEEGDIAGLGLLDLTTELQPHKITQQRNVHWPGGGELTGYEIHHGRTEPGSRVQPHLSDALGWQQQNVIGVYLHDIFKNTSYRQWWLQTLGWRSTTYDWHGRIDAELDRIAKLVVTTGWARTLD